VGKLDRTSVSETVRKIHGPAKMIPHSLRMRAIKGKDRIMQVIEPEPSPWPRRFEMIGVAIAFAVFVFKTLFPKKNQE
jgi:hypothetical protein